MKRSRFGVSTRLLALLAVVGAAGFAAPAPAFAGARASDDALTLVPADAASIAVIRFNELRSSPLASRLFNDADHVGGNGEAARFMEEANLKPRQDVDTAVVVGLVPSGSGETPVLALFEGRFDPERLSAAAVTRGATRISTSAGDYFLLPEKGSSSSSHGKGAVAFASTHLVIGGTESAVASALAARSAGGTSFLSGAGLGRQLSRVDRGSSVWALVDVSRYPQVQSGFNRGGNAHHGSEAGAALFGAMKSVTFFSFQATVHSDDLALVATGVSPDAETRQLLEDSLKGVVAMWRLAVQEKQPDLVTVLRRFKIDSSGDAVTVSGTLPGSVVRSLAEKRSAAK
jgi:hypothetical protein